MDQVYKAAQKVAASQVQNQEFYSSKIGFLPKMAQADSKNTTKNLFNSTFVSPNNSGFLPSARKQSIDKAKLKHHSIMSRITKEKFYDRGNSVKRDYQDERKLL